MKYLSCKKSKLFIIKFFFCEENVMLSTYFVFLGRISCSTCWSKPTKKNHIFMVQNLPKMFQYLPTFFSTFIMTWQKMNIIATYNIFILPKPKKNCSHYKVVLFIDYHNIFTIMTSSQKRISFLHFNNKNKHILKLLQLRWGEECQVILHYLCTLHHQFWGKQSIITSNKFLELLTSQIIVFENKTCNENNLMTIIMVKVLWYIYIYIYIILTTFTLMNEYHSSKGMLIFIDIVYPSYLRSIHTKGYIDQFKLTPLTPYTSLI